MPSSSLVEFEVEIGVEVEVGVGVEVEVEVGVKLRVEINFHWGGWPAGWLDYWRIKLSQLPTMLKLKLKLKLSLAISPT